MNRIVSACVIVRCFTYEMIKYNFQKIEPKLLSSLAVDSDIRIKKSAILSSFLKYARKKLSSAVCVCATARYFFALYFCALLRHICIII